MLNWRRDPGYEQRMNANRIAIERSKERTKLIEKETEQIENEILQLRQETARLRQLNAKEKALSDSIRQLCFPPESSSIPPIPTAPDCKPS
jgi:hypothetical protein